jgi:hypothetical protein
MIVVFGVNLKMYRYNCSKLAPKIKAGLEWFYFMYSRAKNYEKIKDDSIHFR